MQARPKGRATCALAQGPQKYGAPKIKLQYVLTTSANIFLLKFSLELLGERHESTVTLLPLSKSLPIFLQHTKRSNYHFKKKTLNPIPGPYYTMHMPVNYGFLLEMVISIFF
jgi:hypothetical protein